MARPQQGRRGSLPAVVGARPVARQGLSSDEIAARLRDQGGRCMICRKPITAPEAQVDHDHAMAALHPHPDHQGCRLCFRALLCGPCNRMLGHARDDADVLMAAAGFLRYWRTRHPLP